MAAGTTTMAAFLVAAMETFDLRFGDEHTVVCMPDGYAKKVKEGYEGAMIVLALEFAARDPEQEQGGFDPPALATLRVRVYTAVGFTEYDGEPDAYRSGLALVSDIIGWCDRRRFVEGQYGVQFVSMDTADYDVTETFQVQWVIDFTAPLRFDHDRPTAADDDFVSYGDYDGLFPPTRVRGRFPFTVGALSVEMADAAASATLTPGGGRPMPGGRGRLPAGRMGIRQGDRGHQPAQFHGVATSVGHRPGGPRRRGERDAPHHRPDLSGSLSMTVIIDPRTGALVSGLQDRVQVDALVRSFTPLRSRILAPGFGTTLFQAINDAGPQELAGLRARITAALRDSPHYGADRRGHPAGRRGPGDMSHPEAGGRLQHDAAARRLTPGS